MEQQLIKNTCFVIKLCDIGCLFAFPKKNKGVKVQVHISKYPKDQFGHFSNLNIETAGAQVMQGTSTLLPLQFYGWKCTVLAAENNSC